MKKKLKFMPKLIPLMLDGSKTITWRVNDDKDLSVGDHLICLNAHTLEQFAEAMIVHVDETTFGQLEGDQLRKHERFLSMEERLKTYSEYYKMDVKEDTPLKVITFELLE